MNAKTETTFSQKSLVETAQFLINTRDSVFNAMGDAMKTIPNLTVDLASKMAKAAMEKYIQETCDANPALKAVNDIMSVIQVRQPDTEVPLQLIDVASDAQDLALAARKFSQPKDVKAKASEYGRIAKRIIETTLGVGGVKVSISTRGKPRVTLNFGRIDVDAEAMDNLFDTLTLAFKRRAKVTLQNESFALELRTSPRTKA